MALLKISSYNEIEDLNPETDFFEVDHEISENKYITKRIYLKTIVDDLFKRLEHLAKPTLTIDILSEQIGTIHWSSLMGQTYSALSADLLNSNYIPLILIEGNSILLIQNESNNSISIDKENKLIKINRSDVLPFINLIQKNDKLKSLCEIAEKSVIFSNVDKLANKYVFNDSSLSAMFSEISSVAPAIDGNFINGNTDGNDLTSKDAFKIITSQSAELTMQTPNAATTEDNNMSVLNMKFDASKINPIYSGNKDAEVVVDTVKYIPYIIISLFKERINPEIQVNK